MPCSLARTACRFSEGQVLGPSRSARRGMQHAGGAPTQCASNQQRLSDDMATGSRDPKLYQERSSVTVASHGICEPAQRSRSPTATLSNALFQTAASEATSQLWGAVTQANKLSRGFQPRPVGYPPGQHASMLSASDRMHRSSEHKASQLNLSLTEAASSSGPSGDSAADMLRDPLKFIERVTGQYGSIVGLILGGERVILVADAAAAQRALMTRASIYTKVSSCTFSMHYNRIPHLSPRLLRLCMDMMIQPCVCHTCQGICLCQRCRLSAVALQTVLPMHNSQQRAVPCKVSILEQHQTLRALKQWTRHPTLFKWSLLLLQEGTAFFPGSSLAGEGLLVTDGAVWQRQRQLTNPAFRRAAVEAYAAVRPGKSLALPPQCCCWKAALESANSDVKCLFHDATAMVA